jgi:prepilin-type N-terminal cleavage/methylation domain-containing protein
VSKWLSKLHTFTFAQLRKCANIEKSSKNNIDELIVSMEKRKSFTLIELLVVIAVIGMLSSIVLVSLGGARKKARDAKRMSELRNLQTAILIYYEKYGRMPINRTPRYGYCDSQPNFLQELVDDGLIAANPKDPLSPARQYCYYDYGLGNNIGALLVSTLETYTGTTGLPPSCRPWAPGQNWCDQSNNSYYCLCTPY